MMKSVKEQGEAGQDNLETAALPESPWMKV